MSRILGIGLMLGSLLAASSANAGGFGVAGRGHGLSRLAPVGGWNPDGRGIFHWWDAGCLSSSCAPDDYVRKPLPRCRCVPRWVTPGHSHGKIKSTRPSGPA